MTSPELPIVTERLLLRPFSATDLDAFSEYHLLPALQWHFDSPVRDRVECKAALETACRQVRLHRPGDIVTLAVTRAADNAVVGEVSMIWTDATAAQAELRFAINPRYGRRGYGTEAVAAILDFGFEAFGFHRVFVRCGAKNSRAVKLLKSLGMRLEAHFREHALYRGEWNDELLFAILEREWRRGPAVKEFERHRVA
jgi:RimJ/RimL family protein N-acetyltransferase